MKKYTAIPLFAVLGGAVAFALRLLQNLTGFEAGTGLPISGNPVGILLAAFLLAAAVVLFLLSRKLPGTKEVSPAFPSDFSTENPKQLTLMVMGTLLMGLSGLADLLEGFGFGNLLARISAAADPYELPSAEVSGFPPQAQILLGVLALLTAAGLLTTVSACRRRESGAAAFNNIVLLLAPVMLVVRLVLTYRLDSVNPVLAAYYVELLALIFLTLGFYRLASFAFGAGQIRPFTLYAGLAVVLSLTALADSNPHLSSLLLYVGGALTLLGFLFLTPCGTKE